jgi:hypothetical protein
VLTAGVQITPPIGYAKLWRGEAHKYCLRLADGTRKQKISRAHRSGAAGADNMSRCIARQRLSFAREENTAELTSVDANQAAATALRTAMAAINLASQSPA